MNNVNISPELTHARRLSSSAARRFEYTPGIYPREYDHSGWAKFLDSLGFPKWNRSDEKPGTGYSTVAGYLVPSGMGFKGRLNPNVKNSSKRAARKGETKSVSAMSLRDIPNAARADLTTFFDAVKAELARRESNAAIVKQIVEESGMTLEDALAAIRDTLPSYA